MSEQGNPDDQTDATGRTAGPGDGPSSGPSSGPSGGTTTGTDQQERSAPPPPPRQLRRRTDQEVIGGVAAGLGEYFRIDPVVVRIIFVIAAFASGAGVIAYLIGWFLIPDQEGKAEIGGTLGADARPETPPWVWVALAVGAVVVLGGFSVQRGPSLLVAAGLVALGVLLVHRDSEQQRAARGGEQGTTRLADGGSTAWDATADRPAGTWGAWSEPERSVDTGEPATADAEARTAREAGTPPSPLTRVTLGLAVGSVAIMAALHTGDAAVVPLVAWTAVPLVIIGAGLVLGSLRGGVRGLIGWGIGLAVALAVSLGGVSLLPAGQDLSGATVMAVGALDERPGTPADLVSSYAIAVGQVTLDLRRLDADDLVGRTLALSAGVGQVEVLLSDDVPVQASASAGLGGTELLGRRRDGVRPQGSALDRVDAESGDPVLTLDLRAGIGEIVVRRTP
jgi:phage shock protein PspC (stress-responsive transcriptional regulator)